MHRSRLGTLVIDCETDDLDGNAEFWAAALGCKVLTRNVEPEDNNYRGLESDPSQPKILIQKVNHPSRVHLDMETDDIDAEVARLQLLGAKKVEEVRCFRVLEASSGTDSAWFPRSVWISPRMRMYGRKNVQTMHDQVAVKRG